MTQTHTPGPWLIRAGGDVRDFTTFPAEIYSEADADELGGCAAICTIPDDKRQKANARLIAAAPETAAERDRLKEINAELLEALEHCQLALNGNRSAVDEVIRYEAYTKASAAIARTRGQA